MQNSMRIVVRTARLMPHMMRRDGVRPELPDMRREEMRRRSAQKMRCGRSMPLVLQSRGMHNVMRRGDRHIRQQSEQRCQQRHEHEHSISL
ncbi:MAG: hypothetical protein JWL77_3287 [Chthonomonadaceae bacterium]|nr:hypothetical protein [Chthonomonadaceae bacterium]